MWPGGWKGIHVTPHLDKHGLLDVLDHWSFSDEVGHYKPSPLIFESRPLKLWCINAGYQTVVFTVMGTILGAWH